MRMQEARDAHVSYTEQALRERVVRAREVEQREVELGNDVERGREMLRDGEQCLARPGGGRIVLAVCCEQGRGVVRQRVERNERPAGLWRVGMTGLRVITDALRRRAACASA